MFGGLVNRKWTVLHPQYTHTEHTPLSSQHTKNYLILQISGQILKASVFTKVTGNKQTIKTFLKKFTGLTLISVINPVQMFYTYRAGWLSSPQLTMSCQFPKVLHFNNASTRRTRSNDKARVYHAYSWDLESAFKRKVCSRFITNS